jgi:phospholipid/cholesterol/gamma-HCH transport system substrate-binding protein
LRGSVDAGSVREAPVERPGLEPRTRESRTREPLQSERGSIAARVIALAAVIAAVALLALAIFGDGSSYQVKGIFQNAGQLVNGNQVRVGGKPVGTISDIELNDRAQAVVTMNLDDEFSPLHEGTSATIRATSLSGIANRYVSLNPGPNSAEEIPDGGVIDADDTTAPVDIDVLFNSLDARTREGLRNVIRGSGTQYAGRGEDAGESIKYFAPFLSSTTALTRELALDQEVLERFIADGAATVSAVAERSDDLEQLVSNTSTAMGAIADENVALQRALELLPDTLRKANTTFVNLRATLDDLALLVDVSKPATKDLAPFLRDLRPVVAEARPTVADLRDLISTPGPNNDLIDLTAQQPRLAQLTATVFPRAIRTLDRAQPVVEYARGYTPDLAGWLTKFGQAASFYDANGHYARVQPVFSPSNLRPFNTAGSLAAVLPGQRLDDFQPGAKNRCPGGATQPTPDGSAPWPFMGCDTSTTPPIR